MTGTQLDTELREGGHQGSIFIRMVEQVAAGIAGGEATPCGLVTKALEMWEPAEVSAGAQQEWNQWAANNNCAKPFPDEGTATHGDLDTLAAIFRTGPTQSTPQQTGGDRSPDVPPQNLPGQQPQQPPQSGPQTPQAPYGINPMTGRPYQHPYSPPEQRGPYYDGPMTPDGGGGQPQGAAPPEETGNPPKPYSPECVADLSLMPRSTTEQVLRETACQSNAQDLANAAWGIVMDPRSNGNAIWAYNKGDDPAGWHIVLKQNLAAGCLTGNDETATGSITPMYQRTNWTCGRGGPGTQTPPPGPGDDEMPATLMEFAREPIVRQCRRCPRGYIMGNEMLGEKCYPKQILTSAKWRKNAPRRALINHSDKLAIQKAKAAIKRIEEYGDKKAREFAHAFPEHRRTRRRETATERHEREHHRK